MEAGTSETSTHIYQTARHHVPEQSSACNLDLPGETAVSFKWFLTMHLRFLTRNNQHVHIQVHFVNRWFCAVHGPKRPLHRHNSLSFGKFQDTERFLIHCARYFSSRLPPSGGTCKYAKAPSTKTTLRDPLPIDMLLSAVSVLVVAQSSSEVPEGLMNNPVIYDCFGYIYIFAQ